MRRSMLFLPGNAPNMIINGGTLRADSVILDLEDSVAPGERTPPEFWCATPCARWISAVKP